MTDELCLLQVGGGDGTPRADGRLLCGIEVSHEAIRDWETKLLPIMGEALRKRRHRKRRGPGASWYVDETYLKVRGKWAYLYRAVDRDGNLIDAMLSEHRDMVAAKALFRSAKGTMGFPPDRVTTDGTVHIRGQSGPRLDGQSGTGRAPT